MKKKLNILNEKEIVKNINSDLKYSISLKIYSELDSTNNQAKEFIQKADSLNKDKIMVFAADQQSSGRGRRGHSWFSNDPASLSVSFLFRAQENLDNIPQITAAAALAVKDTFEKFKLQSKIKWPNDILAADKKICGILSELIFDSSENPFVIIGCGINLNNSNFNSEIKEIATSYYLERKKKIDKNIFLAELIKKMDQYIKKYFSTARKEILELWKEELQLKGKKIDLDYKNKSYTVIIKDILDSGEILVSFEDGSEMALQALNTSLDYQSLEKYKQ